MYIIKRESAIVESSVALSRMCKALLNPESALVFSFWLLANKIIT